MGNLKARFAAIPWWPELEDGKLGQIQLERPVEQTWPLFKLPVDVLKIIYSMTGTAGPILLETCRTAYKLFSPLASWVNILGFHEKAVGFFMDEFIDFNLGTVIRKDGTFLARRRGADLKDQKFEGTWALVREGNEALLLNACPLNLESNDWDTPGAKPYIIKLRFLTHKIDPYDYFTVSEAEFENHRRDSEDEVIKDLPPPVIMHEWLPAEFIHG